MKTEPGVMAEGVRRSLWFAWQAIRLPVLAFLITLEPVVRFTLLTVALLGLLTAFFFQSLGTPHFPFWGMVGFSVGCTLVLMVYYALMRVFSK